MQEAWCYTKLGGSKVSCNLCTINCRIVDGKRGKCGTRINTAGKLYSTVYGRLSSFSTDFVEKVPLYHFFPNHRFLTVGGVGCNLSCKFCLTWNITQKPAEEIKTEEISPERLISSALELNCKGIAFTHSEPTLDIEFYSSVMERSKKSGLVNVLATNGFISIDSFKKISGLVDAVALTIKGDREFYKKTCGVHSEPSHFMELVKLIKDKGIHLELIYLLIPGENDSMESLESVIDLAKKADAPLIFLRFFPSYKMEDLESSTEEDLEQAVNLAYSRGLDFVYMENIFEHPGKNTYCPVCRSVLIERAGYGIVGWNIESGKCPGCGEDIEIAGEPLLSTAVFR